MVLGSSQMMRVCFDMIQMLPWSFLALSKEEVVPQIRGKACGQRTSTFQRNSVRLEPVSAQMRMLRATGEENHSRSMELSVFVGQQRRAL
jgi:hypothetical protein